MRPSIIVLFIIMFTVACSMRKHIIPLPTKPVFSPMIFLVIPQQAPKDTVRKLNENQRQALLDKYYKYNYDKYFSPEFLKLRNIIGEQAVSIKNQAITINGLSVYMAQTRKRTDSIAKERNYYREQYIKNQQTALRYQKELLAIEKDNEHKNDKQIRANSIMAISCLIGVTLLAVAYFSILYKVNQLYKRFNDNFNNLTHV